MLVKQSQDGGGIKGLNAAEGGGAAVAADDAELGSGLDGICGTEKADSTFGKSLEDLGGDGEQAEAKEPPSLFDEPAAAGGNTGTEEVRPQEKLRRAQQAAVARGSNRFDGGGDVGSPALGGYN